jgi:hypothetical protein
MLNVSEAADVCGLGTEGGQGEMFCVEFGTGSWNWILELDQKETAGEVSDRFLAGFWQTLVHQPGKRGGKA